MIADWLVVFTFTCLRGMGSGKEFLSVETSSITCSNRAGAAEFVKNTLSAGKWNHYGEPNSLCNFTILKMEPLGHPPAQRLKK